MVSSLSVLGSTGSVEINGRSAEDGWRITLAETGEETMTGGRVAAIRRYVADDGLFHLTYGDGVSDVDLTTLTEFHRAHGRVASVTAVSGFSLRLSKSVTRVGFASTTLFPYRVAALSWPTPGMKSAASWPAPLIVEPVACLADATRPPLTGAGAVGFHAGS